MKSILDSHLQTATLVMKFIKSTGTVIYWSEDLSFIFTLFPENSFCDIAWSISFANIQIDNVSFLNKVYELRLNFLVKCGKKSRLLLNSIKQLLSAGLNVLCDGHWCWKHTWNRVWQDHWAVSLICRTEVSSEQGFRGNTCFNLTFVYTVDGRIFMLYILLYNPVPSCKRKIRVLHPSDHVLWKYSHGSRENSQVLKVGPFLFLFLFIN